MANWTHHVFQTERVQFETPSATNVSASVFLNTSTRTTDANPRSRLVSRAAQERCASMRTPNVDALACVSVGRDSSKMASRAPVAVGLDSRVLLTAHARISMRCVAMACASVVTRISNVTTVATNEVGCAHLAFQEASTRLVLTRSPLAE